MSSSYHIDSYFFALTSSSHSSTLSRATRAQVRSISLKNVRIMFPGCWRCLVALVKARQCCVRFCDHKWKLEQPPDWWCSGTAQNRVRRLPGFGLLHWFFHFLVCLRFLRLCFLLLGLTLSPPSFSPDRVLPLTLSFYSSTTKNFCNDESHDYHNKDNSNGNNNGNQRQKRPSQQLTQARTGSDLFPTASQTP